MPTYQPHHAQHDQKLCSTNAARNVDGVTMLFEGSCKASNYDQGTVNEIQEGTHLSSMSDPVSAAPSAEGSSQTAGDASATNTSPTAVAPSVPATQSLRDDQIQNAVAFLTHPKVRDSAIAVKRSFLERKGLTAAEIDEAFRRVPEQPAASVTTTTTTTSTAVPVSGAAAGTGLITYQQQQPGSTVQQAQYQPVHGGVPQQAYNGQMVPYQQPGQMVPAQPPAPEPLRWSQVLLGLGVVAAGLYAVKAYVLPSATGWYHSWVERSRAAREAQEQQAAALKEAVEALKTCQADLRTNSEAMSKLLETLQHQAAQQSATLMSSEFAASQRNDRLLEELTALRRDIRSSSSHSNQYRHGHNQNSSHSQPNANTHNDTHKVVQDDYRSTSHSNNHYGQGSGSGLGDERTHKQGSNSARYSQNGDRVWNRGTQSSGYETPSWAGQSTAAAGKAAPWSIKQYDDEDSPIAPPPGGYLGSGRASVASGYGGNASGVVSSPAKAADGSGSAKEAGDDKVEAGRTAPSPPPDSGSVPYPTSFHEVMEMVQKGITPPNVRTDIKDLPPDPDRPISQAAAKLAPKPWERQQQQQPQFTTPSTSANAYSSAARTSPSYAYPVPGSTGYGTTPGFGRYPSADAQQTMDPGAPRRQPGDDSRSVDTGLGGSAGSGAFSSTAAESNGRGDDASPAMGSMYNSIFGGVHANAGRGHDFGASSSSSTTGPAALPAAPVVSPLSVLKPNPTWKPPPPPTSSLPTLAKKQFTPGGNTTGNSVDMASSSGQVGVRGGNEGPSAGQQDTVSAPAMSSPAPMNSYAAQQSQTASTAVAEPVPTAPTAFAQPQKQAASGPVVAASPAYTVEEPMSDSGADAAAGDTSGVSEVLPGVENSTVSGSPSQALSVGAQPFVPAALNA